jgi:hypothetical protein
VEIKPTTESFQDIVDAIFKDQPCMSLHRFSKTLKKMSQTKNASRKLMIKYNAQMGTLTFEK